MNFNARLKRLEQRREAATKQPFRLIIRPVFGPTNLENSTCKRTLAPDGSLMEIVRLDGDGADLSDDELERFIASAPIHMPSGHNR